MAGGAPQDSKTISLERALIKALMRNTGTNTMMPEKTPEVSH